MYQSLNTIVHLADLTLTTFIVLFERESFIIAGTVRYSSTTSISPENMRFDSLALPLIEKVVYNSLAFKPRIIVPKHLSRDLIKFSFVPIKGNQILLFAKYKEFRNPCSDHFLHLSIHEIRSDNRVGPALWSFNSSVNCDFNTFDFELIESTENPLFGVQFCDHWELFDISTTETNASDNFPLIECGSINFDAKIKGLKWMGEKNLGLCKIFMQC